MSKTTKVFALSLGIVILVGVLGIGAAFASTPTPTSTNYHDVFVGKVAKILGLDQQKVDSAFTQAQNEMVDEAVKDGQMTQQQADWMKQRQQQMQQGGFGPGMMGVGPMHGGPRGGQFGGPWGPQSQATPTVPSTR